jgi:hypothetical protein
VRNSVSAISDRFHFSKPRWFFAVLLAGCLPSLIINRGLGRAVLLHGHEEGPLHAHVVASSHGEHLSHDQHHHDHPDVPPPSSESSGEPLQGAVIRGAEATISVKPVLTALMDAVMPDWLLIIEILPDHTPTNVARFDLPIATGHADVAALRTVVLLI